MDSKTVRISVDGKLYNDINNYCSLNGLNTNKYINELLRKEFLVSKYGDAPFLKQQVEEVEAEPLVVELKKYYVSPVTTITAKEEVKQEEVVKVEEKPVQSIRRKRKLK